MTTGTGDGEGVSGAAVETAGREPAAGYEALTAGCAVCEALPSSSLVLTGEDRQRFLNGQITCAVGEVEPGTGVYGFLLNAKGRILADAVVSAHQDRLRVELPPGAAVDLGNHLGRFVVADRVDIAAIEGGSAMLVAGPLAAGVVQRALQGEALPAGWDHRQVGSGEHRILVRAERRLGVPAWRLEVEGDPTPLVAALEAAGARRATAGEVDVVRVERGLPRGGVDFGLDHFPQETGLEEWAVSYTKGCYVGQEVVARIHYRGKVNNLLRGLRGSGEKVPATGSPLLDPEGQNCGLLTSSVYSPSLARPIGLAIVHRRAAAADTTLSTVDGIRLAVVELPFVQSAGAPQSSEDRGSGEPGRPSKDQSD